MREKKTRSCMLMLFLGAAAMQAVEVEILIASASGATPEATEFYALSLDSAEEPEEVSLKVDASTDTIRLPRSGMWRLSARADGWWFESRDESFQQDGVEFVMRAWKTVPVQARLILDPDNEPPDEIEVRFQSAPKAKVEIPQGTLACPVDEKRVLQCDLPVGKLDIRFRAPGFVAVYRWDVKLSSEKEQALGNVPFRRGVSIAGWVETVDGLPAKPSCLVQVGPRTAGRLDPSGRLAAGTLHQKTQVNSRGFFKFEGLDPGEYSISVEQKGFAPTTVPVRVLDGWSGDMPDPIVLKRPEKVELFIQPPTTVTGARWTLKLHDFRVPSNPQYSAVATANESGHWSWEDLAPGRYLLQVKDERGSIWHSQYLAVGEDSTPHFIEIETVTVQGKVLLGETPLAAKLTFLDGEGQVRMSSDEEGSFQGELTHLGRWRVRLKCETPPIRRNDIEVEVNQRLGKSFAQVEIRLPDTGISGIVVDEEGAEFPRANVLLMRSKLEGKPVSLRADDEGRFVFFGIEEGSYLLSGLNPADIAEKSEWVPAEAVENQEVSDIRLVIKNSQTIAGSVAGDLGPVAGATVRLEPAGGLSFYKPAVTDVYGRFSTTLQGGVSVVRGRVEALGFALKMFRAQVSSTEPLDLRVQRAAGLIKIEAPEELYRLGITDRSILVLFRGKTFLTLRDLVWWASLHGEVPRKEVLVVPMIEPGDYYACEMTLGEIFPALQGGLPASCQAHYLPQGGELVIRVGGDI